MTAHPIDTEALRRLADAATEGPWHWDPPSDEAWPSGDESLRAGEEVVLYGWGYDASGIDGSDEDRAFIAAAREAVPALLDALAVAEYRATRAEADQDEWRQAALEERAGLLDALEQIKAREARARLWKETARRAIRGERVLFRVNRQAREQMERERGHLFRVAAERNDATEHAEQAEARIKSALTLLDEDARWQNEEHILARVRAALTA